MATLDGPKTASSGPAAREAERPPRRRSLDVMRGATIAGMILVNNPGSWSHIYAPLRHAQWHGCTPTDLVFPFFLFMVGVAIPFALGRRLDEGGRASAVVPKILRRGVLLFGFGLLLSWFPGKDLAELRIMGVLQRIAICYVAASLLFLFTGRRTRTGLLVALLVGYWALLVLVPVPGFGPPDLDSHGNHLAGWIDRAVLGAHVWRGGVYDPEGLLSTLPALGTALIGVFAGERLCAGGAAARDLLLAGLPLVGLGLAWGEVFPINKPLWTSSYVLYTGGLALVLLAALAAAFDRGELGPVRRALARPFTVYGVNALLVFVGSGLAARTISTLLRSEDGSTIQGRLYDALTTQLSAKDASLAYALLWITCWYAVLEVLYRRRIFLKV